MIQFSIQKGSLKKGNAICFQKKSLVFDTLPYLFAFIQSYSNQELEDKLLTSLNLIGFSDGTIYVLNDIGRSRKIEIRDLECIFKNHIDREEDRKEWIEQIIHKNKEFKERLFKFLQLEPFGDFITELPEEQREYEWIVDLDKDKFILCKKEQELLNVSLPFIREKQLEELSYEIYKHYLAYPLLTK